MEIEVDFSDVPEVTFEEVPPGKYEVVVDSVEWRTREEEEDGEEVYPYLNWTLTISEGAYKDRKLFYITSLSPKSLPYTHGTLASFGVTGKVKFAVDESTDEVIDPALAGEPGVCRVSRRKDNRSGEMRSRPSALLGKRKPGAGTPVAGGTPVTDPATGTVRTFK